MNWKGKRKLLLNDGSYLIRTIKENKFDSKGELYDINESLK